MYQGIPTSWRPDAVIHLIDLDRATSTFCGKNPFVSRGARAYEDITNASKVNCIECIAIESKMLRSGDE